MKHSNLSYKSKLIKFDIKVENPKLWRYLDIYFDNSSMNFFSSAIKKTINKNTLVSVLLTDDSNMKTLNHRWRKINKPTNILSFSVNSMKKEGKYLFVGDIVLSYETIKAECRRRNISFKDHFIHLCLHGILHLLGFDHKNTRDEKEMENIEIKLLSLINIQNPYLINSKDL